jgi:hypothetical protein
MQSSTSGCRSGAPKGSKGGRVGDLGGDGRDDREREESDGGTQICDGLPSELME